MNDESKVERIARRAAVSIAVAAVLLLLATGCKNSLTGSDTGVWTIRVAADCSAKRVANVSVYIDNSFQGYAQPGDSGVSTEVGVGSHSFYAHSSGGVQWGPSTDYIGSGGVTTTLNCTTLARGGAGDFTTTKGKRF